MISARFHLHFFEAEIQESVVGNTADSCFLQIKLFFRVFFALMCGISSGTNVAAARRMARILGEGKTVVTVLPDTAERYFSTPLFDE